MELPNFLKKEDGWICTDPDNEQYGRRIDDFVFEFCERDRDVDCHNEWYRETIDLNHYAIQTIEGHISSYGYSLLIWNKDFILNSYPNVLDANWIIAECIFEQITQY